jgi:gamma-glutamyltranspeptidase/glutathione hydrolase
MTPARLRRALIAALLLCWMAGAALAALHAAAAPASPPLAAPAAEGRQGVVVAGEPLAAEVGLEILRAGGNVVDAAVAVGFALAVTHPEAGNLGGGGFLLYRRASDDRTFFIDFREKAPRRATPELYHDRDGKPVPDRIAYGPLSVGVPGSVAGLCLAAERYATLPLARLVAPAVRLARNGIVVSASLADSLAEAWTWDTLSKDPGASATFGRDGRPLRHGEVLRQTDLAEILEAIGRRGAEAFYRGAYAERLAAGVQALGGVLEPGDLADYRAVERAPLRSRFSDLEILTAPPPSAGGTLLLMMLNMLRDRDLEKLGHNSSAAIHLAAEAMRRAFADRAAYLGDPDFGPVPVARLIDPAYAAGRWAGFDAERATPSDRLGPGLAPAGGGRHTTHYSVLAASGDAVAVTTTINWSYGSGIVVPGTGILLNNEMDDFSLGPESPNLYGLVGDEPNAVAPGKRMLSSMTPAIVTRGGQTWLVLGSPGGSQIPNLVLQVLLNRAVHDMPLRDAVAAPRFHHQWKPDVLRLEKVGFPADVSAALERRGHKIEVARWRLGEVNAAERSPEGNRLIGAPDPRGAGRAAAW